MRAYDELRAQGLVVSRQGIGTWVNGAREARVARGFVSDGDPAVVDLAAGALPAHSRLRELVAELAGVGDEDAAAVLGGPAHPPGGLPALRRGVAEWLSAQGLATAEEQVLITAGEQEAFSLLARRALASGGSAVVEDPTRVPVLDTLRMLSTAVRPARPVTDGHDDLLRLLVRRAPRLVFLVPTLGPRGRVLGGGLRGPLASSLADRDFLVVEDVSQAGLAFDRAPLPLAAHAEAANLVTAGSFAALHWGGLHVGWIRGAAPLIAEMERAKARANSCTPVLDQVLVSRVLAVEEEIRVERIAWLRERLEHAAATLPAALPDFGWHEPEGGTCLWMRLPDGTATELAEIAARFGVRVVAGARMSPGNTADEHVSVVYARSAEVFDEGVRRLGLAWRQYRQMRQHTAAR